MFYFLSLLLIEDPFMNQCVTKFQLKLFFVSNYIVFLSKKHNKNLNIHVYLPGFFF